MSPVDYHAWTHRPKALGGTDPLEFTTPWVVLMNNGQSLPGDGAYHESVMDEVYWDPAITPDPTAGGPVPFTVASVSDGEGHDYWRLTLHRPGWYEFEIRHVFDDIGDGGIDKYAQQRMTQSGGTPIVGDDIMGTTHSWGTDGGSEMEVEAFLLTHAKVWFSDSGAGIFEPVLRQNTGVSKGVGGAMKVFYLGGVGGSTDFTTWEVASV